jgi:hypothetical protein
MALHVITALLSMAPRQPQPGKNQAGLGRGGITG